MDESGQIRGNIRRAIRVFRVFNADPGIPLSPLDAQKNGQHLKCRMEKNVSAVLTLFEGFENGLHDSLHSAPEI